jgi:hypothetical protein
VVFAAVAAYLPVIVVPYAFEDDYWILGRMHGLGGASVWTSASKGGRPLQALLLMGFFSLAPDIDSLRLVRLLGLAGAALVGLLLFYALRRCDLNRWFAAGIAISVTTLPSFQVYVSWAVLFEAPLAALLAGLAWLRASSAFGLERRAGVRRGIEGSALLFCALVTYQPAAMFFWVFAAIDLLRPGQRLVEAARKLAASLAVGALALALGFVVARVGAQHYGGAGRAALALHIGDKLRWFWHQPLVNALNLFVLVPTPALAAAIAAVAAIGIVALHVQRKWEAFGFLAIATVLVPLAYLPNLVVAEDWASYRSIGALGALFTLYTWFGLWGIARVARAATRVTVGVAAAGRLAVAAVAITGVVVAARNVTTLFAKPENVELHMLRSALDSPRLPVERVLFIKPNGTQGAAPLVRYDEFGLPSSFAPWVPERAVRLVLRERGQTSAPAVEIFAWRDAPRDVHSRGVVVDMRKLRRRRVRWSFWTLHGTAG